MAKLNENWSVAGNLKFPFGVGSVTRLNLSSYHPCHGLTLIALEGSRPDPLSLDLSMLLIFLIEFYCAEVNCRYFRKGVGYQVLPCLKLCFRT